MAVVYADDLQRSIEEFVRDGLGPIEVTSIEIEDDYERDGRRILDITIFIQGTPYEVARKEPSGFLFRLRTYVENAYHAFPVVRFRSAILLEA